MTYKKAFILTIFLAFVCHIAATNIYCKKFNSDNGLPDNNVRIITQDEKGFMWFGTPDGLYRFDGYFYTTYKHTRNGHTKNLKNNHITALRNWHNNLLVVRVKGNQYFIYDTNSYTFIDLPINAKDFGKFDIINNDLWLWSTHSGCVKITYNNDKLKYKLFDTAGGQLGSNNIRFVASDKDGRVWISTDEAIYNNIGDTLAMSGLCNAVSMVDTNGDILFVSKDGNIFRVDPNNRLQLWGENKDRLFDITHAASLGNRLILLSSGETIEVDLQTKERRCCRDIQAPGGNIISDNLGNKAIIDITGWLWFLDEKNNKTIKLKVYDEMLMRKIPSPKYKLITSIKDSIIWISTNGNGITMYDMRSQLATSIKASARHDSPTSTNYILDIHLDKDGNLWAADEFQGVTCIAMPRTHISNVLIDSENPLAHDNQINILKRIGKTANNILISNTNGDLFTAPESDLSQMKMVRSNVDARSVCLDKFGRLWIGTRQQGIEANSKWFRHDPNDSTSLSSNNIRFLFCDDSGKVWVATEYDNVDIATTANSNNLVGFSHLPLKEGRVIMQTADKRIWIGTSSGLYTTDCYGSNIEKINIASKEEDNHIDVNCLYQDSKNRIWVGTMGHGIFYCEKPNVWNRLSGLISNEVQSIAEDSDGIIWIGTKKGLTCYNHETGEKRYWYDNNEMLHNYHVENCVSPLPEGKLAFGTHSGIMVYDTAALKSKSKKRNISVTGILVNGVIIEKKNSNDSITLAHNENSLTLRWSVFDYTAGHGIRYAYFLEGYDQRWSEPTEYSFATYRNLPPGEYVLRIKAYDNKSAEPIENSFNIIIEHAWWQTNWAIGFALIITIVIALVVARQLHVVYDLKRRISIERELTEYKLKFFTNISHEFRTPLTIIRGAMDRIKNEQGITGNMKQPIDNMGRNVDRLMRLVNQLMEFRRMQNGKLKLRLEETEVVGFVRSIALSFNDIAERKHINYVFTPNVKVHKAVVDRSHIDKIVYNLLSNAFKYTPAGGSVTIRTYIEQQGEEVEWLRISVEDTGIGVEKKKQQELFERFMNSSFATDSIGIGLNLTKELVTTHKGRIYFKENKPKGSIFTVEVPISREAYDAEDIITHPSITESPGVFVTSTEYKEMGGKPMNNIAVLVVEDDADVSSFLKNELGKYFIVRTATDGNEALAMIESEKPEIVVTDLMMPGMNGMQLTQKLKQNRDTAEIPVVLLTAENDDTQRVKAADNGVDAYITKPFDMRLLIATCKSLIKKKMVLAYYKEMNAAQDHKNTGNSMSTEGEHSLQVTTHHSIITSEADKKFLNMLNNYITQHLSDEQLNVNMLAEKMGYSRTLFYKKVKELLGVSPADYIRRSRMEKAADLLINEKLSITEVAYRVGICDAHYFTKLFKSHYGITPKKYQKDF